MAQRIRSRAIPQLVGCCRHERLSETLGIIHRNSGWRQCVTSSESVVRTVFFVSDHSGVTAETMGHSLLSQFDTISFRAVTLPFISTLERAEEALQKINTTAEVEGAAPIIFS